MQAGRLADFVRNFSGTNNFEHFVTIFRKGVGLRKLLLRFKLCTFVYNSVASDPSYITDLTLSRDRC